MILTTAAIFIALSIALFVVGVVLKRPGIAMFGAIIMVGAGAAGMSSGYQVAVGEDTTITTTSEIQALDDISESSHLHTLEVDGEEPDPIGLSLDNGGSKMYITGESGSVHQYSTTDYNLTLASYERSFDVSSQDTRPTDVEFNNNGSLMYISGEDTNTIYQYDLTDAYNISTASFDESYDISSESNEPRTVKFNSAGSQVYVVDRSTGEINIYSLPNNYQISTAEFDEAFDVSSLDASPSGIGFTEEGDRMTIMGSETNHIYLYEVSEPFNILSAEYFGNTLNIENHIDTPGGMTYNNGGKKISGVDMQHSEVVQYDSSERVNITEESTRTEYENVVIHPDFPTGAIVLLLGTVMLMGSAGVASEQGKNKKPWE